MPRRDLGWAVVAALLAVAAVASPAAAAPRPNVSLDGPWMFRLDPQSAGEGARWYDPGVAFPDSIQVPGAWDAQGFGEETEKLHHNFIGKGWYRREVTIPDAWKGQRVFLCFGGVYRSAKVWIDGQFVGAHLGYISDFEFDVSAYATPGRAIDVVILVDSEQHWNEDALQGCMDVIDQLYTYWGGIWSHVTLEARSAAWIQDLFVQPRTAPAGCAITAAVQGERNGAERVRVEICDAAGACLASQEQAIGKGGGIRVELDLPAAQPWTPETPVLYTARVALVTEAGTPLDEAHTRFGLRTIEIRDASFYVNGVKYFLNGYGDDCVYPDTIAPPADKAFYVERLKQAKSYGFNYVRHHSHFVAPEYYEACDEVGMFVSPELPIAYPRYYARAKGQALDLYKSEWAAVIKRYRNHPAIFDWCMSNELWDGMPALAPELYRIAKELDGSRPVIDTDGLSTNGFTTGTADRPTLDFFTVMYNILTTPLDNPEKFKTGQPLKPIITHEEGNFVHFPRMDEIDLFGQVFKPFWLTDCRDRLARAGLLDEAPAWAEVSQQLYLLCHKANIEALRKEATISGYDWWLFQPWHCGSNGLVDAHRRPISIAPEQVRRFNAPVVLLEEGLKRTYASAQVAKAQIFISNYSGKAFARGAVTCSLLRDGQALDTRSIEVKDLANGEVKAVGSVEFALPEVAEPQRLAIQAALETEVCLQSNDWMLWVYPKPAPEWKAPAPLYASADTMHLLAPFTPQPMPQGESLPCPAVYVARQPSAALVRAAEQGSCLVLLSPADVFPTDCTSFKSAWWLGVFDGDSNAGTYVYDNPVTRGLAPERWCDASWLDLLQGAQTMLLDNLPAPEVLIRALNTHGAPHPFSRYADFEYVWRNKALLAQARVGKGAVIFSGLNFDVAAKNGGPQARYVLRRLIDHACTFPQPKAEWPMPFIEEAVERSAFARGAVVAGFSHLLHHTGDEAQGQSYRERNATAYRIRQEEPLHRVEWETAIAPDTAYATFVFAGGFPFTEQPINNPGFTLAVNGKAILNFDTSKSQALWPSDDGQSALLYVPGHVQPSWSETAGLFYLAIPKALFVPGQSCRIEVRSRGGDNRRYFALNAYADIF